MLLIGSSTPKFRITDISTALLIPSQQSSQLTDAAALS